MSDFILDNFAGTIGATLSSRSPDVGSGYITAGGGDPFIASDGAESNSGAQGICWNTTTPPSADYTVEAILKHKDTQTDQNWHIIGRGDSSSGNRYGLVLYMYSSPSFLRLSRFDGGGETVIGSLDFAPVIGQTYVFQLIFAGATISAKKDGAVIMSGTDSVISSAGKTGLVIQGAATGSTGTRFTKFRAFVADNPITFAAVVPATEGKINLSFSGTIAPSVADFVVNSNGVNVSIAAVSGSGTSWALVLPKGQWIAQGETVKVSYLGSEAIKATVTATNNSAVISQVNVMEGRKFGAFLTFSSATWGFIGTLSPEQKAQINPTGVDIGQWLDTVVIPAGCRYAVFTTKHDGSWCWWPTASGSPHYSVDLVKVFTEECRKRGLGVGLYINVYDPQWVADHGSYGTPSAFTSHMLTEITELLTNYGKIDYLWIDSAAYWPTYTNFLWTTIKTAIESLQPECVYTSNDGASYTPITDHSQVAQYELLGIGMPPSNNTFPADACTTSRADEYWSWRELQQDEYKDVFEIAENLVTLNSRNSLFLLNFAPNTSGLMPASTIAYAAQLGEIVGRQGGALLPLPAEIKQGVDRGDGFIGTHQEGINGSGILGML